MTGLKSALAGLLLSSAFAVAECGKHWVTTWASMPQLVEPHNLPPTPFNGSTGVFVDSTLRQTVYLTQDADIIRLYFSNAFGATDLPISGATVGLPVNGTAGSAAVVPGSVQTVTFSGKSSFIIPPGALVVSDPLNFTIRAQTSLSVTAYLATGQSGFAVTGHPGSRTTSHAAPGSHLTSPDLSVLPGAGKTDHWYFLSSIEAWLPTKHATLAIVGDSITDGRGSTTNGNNRWPDQLLRLLQSSKETSHIAIANQAAGGNRVLNDGLGPSALARLERDVTAQSGVKWALIYEGVNDLGTSPTDPASLSSTGDRLITAYDQIVTRLHRAGIAVFGATITPMSGPGQGYSDVGRERERQRVNEWIRGSGRFDGVVDFDEVVRDKSNGTQLATEYDTGDYLHVNVEGFGKMAERVVGSGLLEKWKGGWHGMV
ncbi:hypothetical protein OQA88_3767 [Cercophora sp. LCS_1]